MSTETNALLHGTESARSQWVQRGMASRATQSHPAGMKRCIHCGGAIWPWNRLGFYREPTGDVVYWHPSFRCAAAALSREGLRSTV